MTERLEGEAGGGNEGREKGGGGRIPKFGGRRGVLERLQRYFWAAVEYVKRDKVED
jgi:hypothetical protein